MCSVSGSTMFLNRLYALWPPTTWKSPFPWGEYAHDSISCSATGLSTFDVSLDYQQLFPLCRCTDGSGCRLVGALECIQASTQQYANHQWTTAPECHPGLSIWLSTKNILLFTISWNPSRFIGLFTNKDTVSPATVTLTLPEDVATSHLCPPAKSPLLINSTPVYAIHCLIGVRPTTPGGYGRLQPFGANMGA